MLRYPDEIIATSLLYCNTSNSRQSCSNTTNMHDMNNNNHGRLTPRGHERNQSMTATTAVAVALSVCSVCYLIKKNNSDTVVVGVAGTIWYH